MAFICLVLVAGLGVRAWRAGDSVAAGLAAAVVLAVVVNAFVCGVLSNPHGRYQTRLAWDAPAVLGLMLGRRR